MSLFTVLKVLFAVFKLCSFVKKIPCGRFVFMVSRTSSYSDVQDLKREK